MYPSLVFIAVTQETMFSKALFKYPSSQQTKVSITTRFHIKGPITSMDGMYPCSMVNILVPFKVFHINPAHMEVFIYRPTSSWFQFLNKTSLQLPSRQHLVPICPMVHLTSLLILFHSFPSYGLRSSPFKLALHTNHSFVSLQ